MRKRQTQRFTIESTSLVEQKLELAKGLHRFPSNAFGSVRELLHPVNVREWDTLMVACSELGTAPDNVSFRTPNRCVILQHLAASIPSSRECANIDGLAFDDVEALFDKYDFRHVIICGHLHCGVIRSWLGPPPKDCSDIGSFWARFEEGTLELVNSNYRTDTFEQRLTLMVCEYVLCQLDNLLTHPFLADRVQKERTKLHGWVLDDDSARVFGYSPQESAFLLT